MNLWAIFLTVWGTTCLGEPKFRYIRKYADRFNPDLSRLATAYSRGEIIDEF